MNFTFKKFIVATWLIFCGLLLLGGLALILQKLPPNPWVGIEPGDELATEDMWYFVNGIAGWLCVFIAAVLAVFLFFNRKKNLSKTAWVVQPALVLLTSSVLAAIGFEIIIQLLNINA
jgi:uncharacterized membrane protein